MRWLDVSNLSPPSFSFGMLTFGLNNNNHESQWNKYRLYGEHV
jgi:hypothetical protein